MRPRAGAVAAAAVHVPTRSDVATRGVVAHASQVPRQPALAAGDEIARALKGSLQQTPPVRATAGDAEIEAVADLPLRAWIGTMKRVHLEITPSDVAGRRLLFGPEPE